MLHIKFSTIDYSKIIHVTLQTVIMNRGTTKLTKWPVRPAKIQFSLADQSSICTLWVANAPSLRHADIEDRSACAAHADQLNFLWPQRPFISFCRARAHVFFFFNILPAVLVGINAATLVTGHAGVLSLRSFTVTVNVKSLLPSVLVALQWGTKTITLCYILKNGFVIFCWTRWRIVVENSVWNMSEPRQANLCLRAFRHDKF